MGEESSLTKASSKSESLRATVPSGIVSFLKLKIGETLEWEMEMKNGERVAIVKPKR
jgi:hypothetical protein